MLGGDRHNLALLQSQQDSHAMSVTADQTSSKSITVAAVSEEALTNVQMVAAVAEQLSVSIQRDQPAGRGIDQHSGRGGRAGRTH